MTAAEYHTALERCYAEQRRLRDWLSANQDAAPDAIAGAGLGVADWVAEEVLLRDKAKREGIDLEQNETLYERATLIVNAYNAEIAEGDSSAECRYAAAKRLQNAIVAALQRTSQEQVDRDRASDQYADVSAFMRKFNQPMRQSPGWPEQRELDMRVRLTAEEFCEFVEACGYCCEIQIRRPEGTSQERAIFSQSTHSYQERDLPAAADGLIDLSYIINGTHCALGIDPRPLWAEVQRANMAKEGGGTREDGKILKPAGWVPPDIERLLIAQGWCPPGAAREDAA